MRTTSKVWEKYPPRRTRGLRKGAPRGENQPNAKLTEAKVREARAWYDEGNVSMLDIADAYGITLSTCRQMLRGETWKHVTDLPVKQCPHCCGSGKIPL